MTPSVQMRIDIGGSDGIPHSFLSVVHPDGQTVEYGLVPAEHLSIAGTGKIDITGVDGVESHEKSFSSEKVSLTNDQYDNLMGSINRSIANPPDYNVAGSWLSETGNNCTGWAINMWHETGLPNQFGITNSWVWNPYGQGLTQSSKDTGENIKGDVIGAIISASNVDEWGTHLKELFPFIETLNNIGHGIMPLVDAINDFFNSAKNWVQPRDPLILDLDGDGLETTGFDAANPIYFDHDLNGIKEGTGWVTSDDGFLVLDRNGNGTIDNGFELFGDHTLLMTGDYAADGFAALAQEDTNQDGKVDATDARFAELRVWRDLNQNGLSEAGELFTLNSLGIAAINVASTDHSQMLANGNQIADLGNYTKTDGSTGITGTLADINLVANPFYRQFTTHPDTSAVANLPDMQGSGQVRDLREAASLFSPLAATLSNFATQNTHAGQLAQLDTLINDWAVSSGMMTGVEKAADHGYRLIYLVPGQTASNYEALFTYCEATGFSPDDLGVIFANFPFSDSEQQQMIQCKAQQQAMTKLISILERFNGETFVNIASDSVRTGAGQLLAVSSSADSTGSVFAVSSTPRMYVTLSTTQINLLNNSFTTLEDSVFGSLIMQTRLKPYLDTISLTITSDGIALDFGGLNALLDSHKQVDGLNAFADLLDLQKYAGDKLNPNGWDGIHQIVRWASELSDSVNINPLLIEFGYNTSTSGDNILIGANGADNFNGQGGNDSFFGGNGNDTLTGHGSFEGGLGDDTLVASGTDYYLYSGDTYVFNLGDGNDTIIEYGSNNSWYATYYNSKDILKFGADVSPATVSLVRNGNDMIFNVSNNDQVTVKDWFVSSDRYIEEVQFADGTVWTVNTLLGMETQLIGTNADDTLTGWAGKDNIDGGEGTDSLIGGLGADNYNLTETTAATDSLQIATGDSLASIGGYDLASGFILGTGIINTTGVDKLDLASTNIAANVIAVDGTDSGTILSHSINNGIISFDDVNHYTDPLTITDTNLANVFSYLQTNITDSNTVAFVAEGNTYVFQDGGVTDTLVELVGVVASRINTTGLAANAVWIA